METIFRDTFIVLAMLGLIVGYQGATALEQQTNPEPLVNPALEKALLAENWTEVAQLLRNVTLQTPSPVERLIKGHADLALNKNNESVCLFLSVQSPQEIHKWDEWTSNFERLHPNAIVMHYLRGDALARLKQWDQAEATLNQVLGADPSRRTVGTNPHHVMSLNALGLVHAAKQNWEAAFSEFSKASLLKPDFADAHASLGAYWMQKKDGAPGALKAFNEAISSSKGSFALAHYGRGSILTVLGKFGEASKDFSEALNTCESLQARVRSYIRTMLQQIQQKEEEQNRLLAELGNNPGTTIETKFMTVLGEVQKGNFGGWGGPLNTANKMVLNHPELKPIWDEQMKTVSPGINNQLHSAIQQRMAWNEGFNKLLGGVKSSVDFKPGGVGVGVGLGYDSKNITDQKLGKFGNNAVWGSMQGGLKPPKPTGGFATSLAEATWDTGDWPFEAAYSLSYPIAP